LVPPGVGCGASWMTPAEPEPRVDSVATRLREAKIREV
jgi:hypothetical protein